MFSVSPLIRDGVCHECARERGMVMMFKPSPLTKKRNTDPKEGCPVCSGGGSRAFNWQIALRGEPAHLHAYTQSMYRRDDLRRGSLWGCKRCSELFYLDKEEETMYHVDPKKLALFQKLAAAPPILPDAHYAKIETLSPINGNIGCCVTTRSRQVVQIAEIKLHRFPEAIFWADDPPHLGTEILDIEASPFVLPYPVRRATYSAKETVDADGNVIRVERTPVESPHGRVFLLDSFSTFFAYKHLRGCDMRLSAKIAPYWSFLGPPVKFRFPQSLITAFWAEPKPV